jgi:hypothetical protein
MRGQPPLRTIESSTALVEAVRRKLTAGDDPYLWETALTVLADEFLQRYNREARNRNWFFLVGACSHWVRPHNSCWTAAGGFVYPDGYQNNLPEFDWAVIVSHQNRSWLPAKKFSGKRPIVFRVAIPSRSVRHKQAAVHTKWSTSQNPVLYGFRKLNGSWKCVAASDERSEGSISTVLDGDSQCGTTAAPRLLQS